METKVVAAWLRAFRLSRWEAVAWCAAAAAVLYQYAPLLEGGFPIETEAESFVAQYQKVSWLFVLGYRAHYSVLILLNVPMKLGAHLYALSAPAFFAALLALHLANVWALIVAGRTAARWILYGEDPAAPSSGGLPGWIGGLTGLGFACFGSYYHALANPTNGLGNVLIYGLLIHFACLLMFRVAMDRPDRIVDGLILLLASAFPFLFFVTPTVLVVLFLAWAAVPKGKRAPRILFWAAGANVAGLAVQMLCLDARFSAHSFAARYTDFSPDRFGLLPNFLGDPVGFLMSTAHTAAAGLACGLVRQNFLAGTEPLGAWYLLGALCLLAWLGAIGLGHPRGPVLQGCVWAVIFGNLFNVCLMRNPLSGELDRVFDAYYVAAQPRYYYLPAALLALSFALAVVPAVDRWIPRGTPRWGAGVLVVLFLAGNAAWTHDKIAYVKVHMADEVYAFTPAWLRPPPTEPGRPSWKAKRDEGR